MVFAVPDFGIDKDPKADTSFEFEYWTDGEPYPWYQVAFYKTNETLEVNLSWEAFLAWFFIIVFLLLVCTIGCCVYRHHLKIEEKEEKIANMIKEESKLQHRMSLRGSNRKVG